MSAAQPEWHCCRTGECCQVVREVVMTHAERAEIERAVVTAPTSVALLWTSHPDSRFTRLLTPLGCPLLDTSGAQASCTVHAVRPMNCRRYGCFRSDVTTQPVPRNEAETLVNILSSRAYKRQALRMERHAQRWGATRGWLS